MIGDIWEEETDEYDPASIEDLHATDPKRLNIGATIRARGTEA